MGVWGVGVWGCGGAVLPLLRPQIVPWDSLGPGTGGVMEEDVTFYSLLEKADVWVENIPGLGGLIIQV